MSWLPARRPFRLLKADGRARVEVYPKGEPNDNGWGYTETVPPARRACIGSLPDSGASERVKNFRLLGHCCRIGG